MDDLSPFDDREDLTLYDKYGGAATVTEMVKAFYRRAMANPLLSHYFRGVAMDSLLRHQSLFVSFMMGKRDPIFAEIDLYEAHRRLRITRTAYEEMMKVLRETLLAAGMHPADAQVLCERLDSRRDAILGADTVQSSA